MNRTRLAAATMLWVAGCCANAAAQAFFSHDFTAGTSGWTTFSRNSSGGGVTVTPGSFTLINSGTSIASFPEVGLTRPINLAPLDPERVWQLTWTLEGVNNSGQAIHATLQSGPGFRRTGGANPDDFVSLDFAINTSGTNDRTATVSLWNGQRAWTSAPVALDFAAIGSAFELNAHLSPVGYSFYSDKLKFLSSGLWPNGRDLAFLQGKLGHTGLSAEGRPLLQAQSVRAFNVAGTQLGPRTSSLPGMWHGWFTRPDAPTYLNDVAKTGAELAIVYATGNPVDQWSPALWQGRLDAAAAEGLKLLISLNFSAVRNGTSLDPMKVLINAVNGHPALAGWYLEDEPEAYNPAGLPTPPGLDRALLERAYNELKPLAGNRPMVVDFGFFMDRAPLGNDISPAAEQDDNPLWRYRNAYDVVIMGSYPANTGAAEFAGMATWKRRFDNAVAAARIHDKTLVFNGQAYGAQTSDAGGQWPDKRLPTAAEAIFQIRYAAMSEVDGMVHWARHRIDTSKAQPGEAYDKDGIEWLNKVYGTQDTPFGYMRYEINLWQTMLPHGAVHGATWTDDEQAILVKLFYDGVSSKAYLLAINASDLDSGTVRLAFDLSALPLQMTGIVGKYFNKLDPQNGVLQSNGWYAFDTTLNAWDTRLWEINGVLIPEPSVAGVVLLAAAALRRRRGR